MASLRHPNIVLFLGVSLDPPCMLTEFCARGSLLDVLHRARTNKVWPFSSFHPCNLPEVLCLVYRSKTSNLETSS